MGCQFTAIPLDTCRSNVGGIKSVYAMPIQNLSGSVVTNGSGSVTTIPIQSGSGFQFQEFDFRKEVGDAKSTMKISDENDSIYYEEAVTFEFVRTEVVKRNNLMILAQSEILMIVLDNLGQYSLYGQVNGLTPITIESDSGKKYGDGSKYKLHFTGKEFAYPSYLTQSQVLNLLKPA